MVRARAEMVIELSRYYNGSDPPDDAIAILPLGPEEYSWWLEME